MFPYDRPSECVELNLPDTIGLQVILEADTPWESCTSPIQYWITSNTNNALLAH